MEITQCGDTCFRIKGKTATVVVNPEKAAGKLKGDIVISSLKEEPVTVDGGYLTFDWPGEYEAREVPVMGIRAWTKSKNEGEENGEGEDTIIFCFSVDGFKFCHLGELGHTLASDMVNKIGDVDILMMDISDDSNLSTKKAFEVIEAIEPKSILFMGKEGPSEILKEIGAEKIEKQDKVVLKEASDLPNDKRTYFSLKRST